MLATPGKAAFSSAAPRLPPAPPPHGKIPTRRWNPPSAKKTDAGESPRVAGGSIFPLRLSKPLLSKAAVAVLGLGFVDAGYSGDWSRIGVISKETEELLKAAAFVVVPLCVFLVLYSIPVVASLLLASQDSGMSQPDDTVDFSSSKPRIPNWTYRQDKILLDLLTDEYLKNYSHQGTFKKNAFGEICARFNADARVRRDKTHLHTRFKNLKKQYHQYEQLRLRSGWGWDDKRNMLTAPDDDVIQAAIAVSLLTLCHSMSTLPSKRPLLIFLIGQEFEEGRFEGGTLTGEGWGMVQYFYNADMEVEWPIAHFRHRFDFYKAYYLITEDLLRVGFRWDLPDRKITGSEILWLQYCEINPLADWFKGRSLNIRSDVVRLFRDWPGISI